MFEDKNGLVTQVEKIQFLARKTRTVMLPHKETLSASQ